MFDTAMKNAPAGQEHGAQDEAVHGKMPGQYSPSPANDATLAVSNREFLETVFGKEPGVDLPMVVSFKGNPRPREGSPTLPASVWAGLPWQGGDFGPADANNYFSLATFAPNARGRYGRKKAQFVALHCVVLDDLGTKVDVEDGIPDASWWLETSEGNYQVGYLLDKPLTDGALADKLLGAIIAAGMTDEGAGGPCARIMRLPVGVNGKEDRSFQCRLASWNPERRFSVDGLVDALGLDLAETPQGRARRSNRPAQAAPEAGDAVWLPRPHENPVLAALRERGLYKRALGEGRHDITCPWVAGHSEGDDSGSAYFEPSEDFPIGGYVCHHGSCKAEGRNITALLDSLGVERSAAGMRPTIRVVQGEFSRIVAAAERALADTGRFYEHAGGIGRIVTSRDTGAVSVHRHDPLALTVALSTAATWERFDAREKGWRRTDPPERHVAALAGLPGYVHLPVLRGLAHQPYVRGDDTLVTQAGYDRASGMYGVFTPGEYAVPDAPDRRAAQAGLDLLRGLVDEFEFTTDSGEASAICGMLMATVRPCLTAAPMVHVRAHSSGSGKTFLTQLLALFASPATVKVSTLPSTNEEVAKSLLSALRESPPVLLFDNMTGNLVAHKSLCAMLTSDSGLYEQRKLGANEILTVSTRSLFLSSGNNVGPVADMARRTIVIDIDRAEEVAGKRTFKRPDLLGDVRRERGRYISAALTVVLAWIAAGRPAPAGHVPLDSFTRWDGMCRQSLMWLGMPDPCEGTKEAIEDDPDRVLLGRLLIEWYAAFDRQPTKVSEALFMLDRQSPLYEIFEDIAGERGGVNREALGKWISRHAGQKVEGLRLARAEGKFNAVRWRVEKVAG